MLKQPNPSKQIIEAMAKGLESKLYPQQVYTLGLEELATGSISSAELAGWRFTGEVAGRNVCVHVGLGIEDKSPAVSRLTYGPYVTKSRDALRKAVELHQQSEHDYELRLLSIPALSLEAVWLKSQTDEQDLLMPYLPSTGLKTMQFYPLASFLVVVQARAVRRLAFDDSPPLT